MYDPTSPPCHQRHQSSHAHGEDPTRAPLPSSISNPTALQLHHHHPALCPECFIMAREAMQLP